MKKYYVIIDVEKCENCQNCFLSCKDEHVGNDWPRYTQAQQSKGPGWIRIETKERGRYPYIDVAYLPVPCMHCDDAPCIKAGKGAIVKRSDGIVMIDAGKAKDHKELVDVCPYGAIQWNEEKRAPQKCTLCAHLLDGGWQKTRCVQSCPTGALSLRYTEVDEMRKVITDEKLEIYLPERKTQPRIYYKNLYRFATNFVGGSVAIQVKGVEECAQGVRVVLTDKERMIDQTVTNEYGDFKFDNLRSGTYTVKIELKGSETKSIPVEVKESVNIGTLRL
jgi:Fe-S-cluster-containing dehydrogenase component